ncbi:P-loop ATPase, Sll1717 family [Methanoculleus caldifontis]|uniref:P-loop ATPase, Sll1717 family n=1 Tax=Methanoculleus caldifontis TaxID=2651577 RepID=UPI002936F5C1|nr:hypothetical protein [Methanoculleus sp. Wushi-C6]
MLPIANLDLGYNDAENYKRPRDRELFNKIFIHTDALDKLCDDNVYFLVGEKGTGKTAYAVYFSNNAYKENYGAIRFLRETEYHKFVTLKQENQLSLSDYRDIWEIIIYFLISQQILENEEPNFISKYLKFKQLQDIMREFFKSAFSPEIPFAIKLVENSAVAAEIFSKYDPAGFKFGGEDKKTLESTEHRYQVKLMTIKQKFREALSTLNLTKNHILFLDGIDIKPYGIAFEDYLDCIKGLANAIWTVNNDFFSLIGSDSGSLRAVLLVRPDIFNKFGLQNQNNRLRDNSVILDWNTTDKNYRTSYIFSIADNLLRSQQDEALESGAAWNYYFPYKIPNRSARRSSNHDFDDSFIGILRHSLYRPRDIVTMMNILRDISVNRKGKTTQAFSHEDFKNTDFQRQLADYYLGEIKDQMSFFYSEKDFEVFKKFFDFLNGKSDFNYSEFNSAFFKLIEYTYDYNYKIPPFCSDADTFLQLLYDLNIISYLERTRNEDFGKFCYKQRTYANLAPKVKTHSKYRIFIGMRKALNIGKQIL